MGIVKISAYTFGVYNIPATLFSVERENISKICIADCFCLAALCFTDVDSVLNVADFDLSNRIALCTAADFFQNFIFDFYHNSVLLLFSGCCLAELAAKLLTGELDTLALVRLRLAE